MIAKIQCIVEIKEVDRDRRSRKDRPSSSGSWTAVSLVAVSLGHLGFDNPPIE